jgi:hypothetical protein
VNDFLQPWSPGDRVIGGPPHADLAAIESSFGVLADQESFSRGPDERMNYLDRLAAGRSPSVRPF